MINKCKTTDILGQIHGIIGVNCNDPDLEIAVSDVENMILDSGELFSILGGDGQTANNVEAQTTTSADGKTTYVLSETKDGYTVDFPPYEVYSKKIKVVKDHFNAGIYIVIQDGAKYRIYGMRASATKIAPFKVSALNKIMPNGRFASGSTAPTNQISFVIEDNDVDFGIGYIVVDTIPESIIGRLVKDSALKVAITLTDNIAVTSADYIKIPALTTVTPAMFRLTTTQPTATTHAANVITLTGAVGDATQVLPIDGIWSFDTVTV